MSKKYEYMRFEGPCSTKEIRKMWLNGLLKEQGEDGWILCTYTYVEEGDTSLQVSRPVAIFMREKEGEYHE